MDLAGKTVLLTGGSNGIGREIAVQLNGKRAKVVLTGRDPDRLALTLVGDQIDRPVPAQ